jgi:hypothetical protein
MLLPKIARLLLRAHDEINILVHTSDPNWMPEEQNALRELASLDDRLVLEERIADGNIWPAIINSIDLMLCPYDPIRYHSSPSAVAFEAVANGIPLVGPKGSSLDRLIRSYGSCGVTFEDFTSESIADATGRVIDHFDAFAGMAEHAATQWAQRSGPSNTINAMLALLALDGTVAPVSNRRVSDRSSVQICDNLDEVGSQHFSVVNSAGDFYQRPILASRRCAS